MNTAEQITQPKRRIPWKNIVVALFVIGTIGGLLYVLPIGEYLTKSISWIETLGVWGPIAFIGIYILAVVFFVPGSLLTAASGTIFGVVWGAAYVSIASTLGATLAFLIGRYLARGWVEKKIAGNESFSAIDSGVAEQGWKIVGLTRLSPVFPFSLLNYAYGITKVKLRHYVLVSWIGMFPGTLLYVYIGSLGKAATESGSKSPAEWAMYGVGLLATVVVTIYITKISRKALQQKIEEK
ncbi:MAG: TVP38/TMEM64 family protein [Verrucomicrobiales bacterium]|nr:TVP38/TMEM64 family protein [Verrucomicrobiales bacterium]